MNMTCRPSVFVDKSKVLFRSLSTFSVENTGNCVVTLTLNNKPNRNALSKDFMLDLNRQLLDIAKSESKVVIIRSGLDKVFSSGHDLKEVEAREDLDSLFAICSDLMTTVKRLPQVSVAEVDGIATAAGCQLVASCDLVVASTNAKFATPGVNIGLFCSTPAVALSRAVAPKHAMEMLLTGHFVDAQHAMRIGLVNRVVPPDNLQVEVQSLSEGIASKSRDCLRIGKETFNKQIELSMDGAYEVASSAMVQNMECSDAQEGIRAFLEKRPPHFTS